MPAEKDDLGKRRDKLAQELYQTDFRQLCDRQRDTITLMIQNEDQEKERKARKNKATAT